MNASFRVYQPPATSHHMRKAISLDVHLWIEGEDEPAHDFAASTIQAIRDILEAGAAKHPNLAVRVKSIRETA
jgi:hypothetical protein